MNQDNTFQYVRHIMLVTVSSVIICATIATIVITQTRKDYATLEHVEEGLALARSSLSNAIQQETNATGEKITKLSEKIAALQKAIESLETPQTTTSAESNQTDDAFHPDSVPCCGGDEQSNSSELPAAQNAEDWINEEEITEFIELIQDDDAESHLHRSTINEEELALLAAKTTEIQAALEEKFTTAFENLPDPKQRKQLMDQMWFFNGIIARVAESDARLEIQIEQDSVAPFEVRMGSDPPELEEYWKTMQALKMLEEAARQ